MRKLSCFGVELNEQANNIRGEVQRISSDNSRVLCYIIPTDEELMIARDTYNIVER